LGALAVRMADDPTVVQNGERPISARALAGPETIAFREPQL
jgi:hypothetical protein